MFKKALVTAGCTEEHLDTVRTTRLMHFGLVRPESAGTTVPLSGLTDAQLHLVHVNLKNVFTGATGRAIAEQLAAKGVETTLVGSKFALAPVSSSLTNLRVRPFESTADLHKAMHEELSSGGYDLVVMSAAVNDYVPVDVRSGKISSDEESLIVEFRRNPKVLDTLREVAGDECYIVGFKLLVGTTAAELTARGRSQIARAKTDLCVSNDLLRINLETMEHPFLLIGAAKESEPVALEGKRPDVVREFVEYLGSVDRRDRKAVS